MIIDKTLRVQVPGQTPILVVAKTAAAFREEGIFPYNGVRLNDGVHEALTEALNGLGEASGVLYAVDLLSTVSPYDCRMRQFEVVGDEDLFTVLEVRAQALIAEAENQAILGDDAPALPHRVLPAGAIADELTDPAFDDDEDEPDTDDDADLSDDVDAAADVSAVTQNDGAAIEDPNIGAEFEQAAAGHDGNAVGGAEGGDAPADATGAVGDAPADPAADEEEATTSDENAGAAAAADHIKLDIDLADVLAATEADDTDASGESEGDEPDVDDPMIARFLETPGTDSASVAGDDGDDEPDDVDDQDVHLT